MTGIQTFWAILLALFLSAVLINLGRALDSSWLSIFGTIAAWQAGRWDERLTQRVRGKS